MSRTPDWPSRLDALVAQRRGMPFVWGVQDCCTFARVAVEQITGRDPAADWPLDYSTARGARAALRRLGGIAALPARAGFAEIPVKLAARGDLVLVENAGRLALAVCIGRAVAAPGADGLEFLSINEGRKAWRVD